MGFESLRKKKRQEKFNSMSKTIEDIIKLNNVLAEIRREKTKKILDKLAIV